MAASGHSPEHAIPATEGKESALAWTVPDTLLILFVLALAAWAATFVFVPGEFSVAGDAARIVPGSFSPADAPSPAPVLGNAERVGFLDFFFAGLVSGDRYSATVGLMAFLLIIGGVFGMISRSRAIDASLLAALPGGKAKSENLVVGLFIGFSLVGAVFGMSEEAIALTLVITPAFARAGYDAITVLLVTIVGTQIGFATSWMNPFSVIVAQSISGLPPLSGMGLRIGLWIAFTLLGASFTWRYARRVRLGQVPGHWTIEDDDESGSSDENTLEWGRIAIMVALGLTIVWVAWGVSARGYYLAELAAQFMALGIMVALVARVARLAGCSLNEMMEAFRSGAAQLLPAALIVGVAKGILLLLGGDDPASPSLMNTLLDSLAALTAMAPEWMTAWVMYLAQSAINFFIASGSGQASVTMPIMAPLADLSGVTRQTAVLAFQLGDGLTNLVIPTSAVLMGCLAAAKVSYTSWIAFIWKPMLALMGIASLVVMAAHGMGY
ncbi:putative basic amino acid antiporter YfcC [Qipengyuania qiaonensis]|uniref:Basic amino acid antiporter YfcC n=1 Tax=Qipengyuania qiaonensis TaxID=2867240 RepID=A0ABS7J921_9SPHN|nr:putative basic amino acid antiporter YfcC [Qipengyuania qiaonensis]MBX7483815.1 putative basic amino acid antiporter YfcC [Qipengyuania qiaonensis]